MTRSFALYLALGESPAGLTGGLSVSPTLNHFFFSQKPKAVCSVCIPHAWHGVGVFSLNGMAPVRVISGYLSVQLFDISLPPEA